MAVQIPIEQRLAKSQAIVYGKVISKKSLWDDEKKSIYTLNEVSVSDEWNNSILLGDRLFLLTEGGDLGTIGRTVVGTLSLEIGDEGYFMIEKPRSRDVSFTQQGYTKYYRIYADIQGMLTPMKNQFIKDCWGKTTFDIQKMANILTSKLQHSTYNANDQAKSFLIDTMQSHNDNLKISGKITFDPPTIIGGKGEAVTIKGTGFGATRGNNYVTFTNDGTNYHDATYARSFVYRKWSDTEIIVEVPPSYSDKVRVVTGSTQQVSDEILRVTSNIATRSVNPIVYNQLVNTNDKGGYTWVLDKQLFDNKEARECTESVMRQFRCKTNMSFVLSDKPLSTGYKFNDGVNSIVFDAPGYELPDGIVAYCEWAWYSCVVGNQTMYYIPSFDCRLSTKFEWYYGKGKNPKFGMAKLRYNLFHEIGHAMQFGHVSEEGQTMHPVTQALPTENWLERDTITESEQKMGKYFSLYNQNMTFQGCGLKKLLPPQLTDCNIDLLAINVLKNPSDTTACKGENVEFSVDANPIPGDLDLQYQWYKDSQPIDDGNTFEGVNSPRLIIKKVNESLLGNYSVEISTTWTGVGNTKKISESGRLSLNIAPKVVFIPKETIEVCAGSTADISVGVYGKEFDYKLVSINDDKSNPSSDTSSFTDTLGDSTTILYSLDFSRSLNRSKNVYDLSYKVIASSSCGSDTSNTFLIKVYESDSIVQDLPKTTEIPFGDTLKLTVSAIGNNLTYQWFKNLKPISGATSQNLLIPVAKYTDNGQYFCIISGFCNSDTSSFTACTVKGPSSADAGDNNSFFEISPNPSSEQIKATYYLSSLSQTSLLIADLTGKVIEKIDLGLQSEGYHTLRISTLGYPVGMYTLVLFNRDKAIAKQVTIIQ